MGTKYERRASDVNLKNELRSKLSLISWCQIISQTLNYNNKQVKLFLNTLFVHLCT